ncbi:MAG: DEAD/DEAH box helicase [Cardiobacteriaceae bacterium]|nr:DEAD/DEAH box helicase [Cardiobacteriaceae bacterium]
MENNFENNLNSIENKLEENNLNKQTNENSQENQTNNTSEDLKTFQSFNELNLEESIKYGIEAAGFTKPTPIQEKTLPLTLAGYDVMGIAQTGTGKTAAFLISLLQYLMVNPVHPKAKGSWAIVLAPTRELAVQIKKDLNQLGKWTGLTSLAVYGGTSIEQQKQLFSSANIDIIIGTPGRIIDLYKQKVFHLKNIEVVVLDEADRMFDLGFIDDVRYLLKQMPAADERLNLLFSATMPQRVKELAYEHFNAPKTVGVEASTPTAQNITEELYHTAKHEKTPLLLGLLQQENISRAIVFLNTKRDLERLSAVLNANGCKNSAIYGDIAQRKREQVLKNFQDGKVKILLATDVAARGIHIPDVSHVFNYDLPQTAEDYVHRIGRTARAGASGKAISFADEEYVYSLPEIEHYIGRKIPVISIKEELLADLLPLSDAELKEFESSKNNRQKPQTETNWNTEANNYNNSIFANDAEKTRKNNSQQNKYPRAKKPHSLRQNENINLDNIPPFSSYENNFAGVNIPYENNQDFANSYNPQEFNQQLNQNFNQQEFDGEFSDNYPAQDFYNHSYDINAIENNAASFNNSDYQNFEQQNFALHDNNFSNEIAPTTQEVNFSNNDFGNQNFETAQYTRNSFSRNNFTNPNYTLRPKNTNRFYQNPNNRRKLTGNKFRRIVRKNNNSGGF